MTSESHYAGLYIHVPFCNSKCPYCGFYSIASLKPVESWIAGLEKEIQYYKNWPDRFDTLYVGGGTPTCLKGEHLQRVMDMLFTHFPFTRKPEITLEANPCHITREVSQTLFAAGFNRVSLGVQSFSDRVLAILERRHSAKSAVEAISFLREAGFQNLSLDLIYGIPGQSFKDWMGTLKEAMTFQPDHLSCYQLTVEPKTLFERRLTSGALPLPSEKESVAFFLTTSAFLEKAGYVHYEVSSFARGSTFTSRHNQKYWAHVPYLGLGPSAHSFDGTSRWWNVSSVKRYGDMLDRGLSPVAGRERLTPEQRRLESLALGFRTRRGGPFQDLFPKPLRGAGRSGISIGKG